jgi:transposase
LDKAPTASTKKADIIQWLENKGEVVDRTMIIRELLDIVKKIKPQHEKFVIDEIANAQNKTILRLPPYHCELNPIELAWSSIKNHVRLNNTTFKLPDVKKTFNRRHRKSRCRYVEELYKTHDNGKNRFWEIDDIMDEVFEAERQNLTLTITGDTSSDSESDMD